MSVPYIILLSWPSVCQKSSNLVETGRSSDKNKLDNFWHTLYNQRLPARLSIKYWYIQYMYALRAHHAEAWCNSHLVQH